MKIDPNETRWVTATCIGIVATIATRCVLTPDLCRNAPSFSRILDYGSLFFIVVFASLGCGYVRASLDVAHFYRNPHDQLRLWLRLTACTAAGGVLFFDVLRFATIHANCALFLMVALLTDEVRIAVSRKSILIVCHFLTNVGLFTSFIIVWSGWYEIAGILSAVVFFIHDAEGCREEAAAPTLGASPKK